MIRCNLKMLIAEKEIKEGRRISYRDIQEATGIAPSTLVGLANNNFRAIYVNTIEKLCEYFSCSVCDLLEHCPDATDNHVPAEKVTQFA